MTQGQFIEYLHDNGCDLNEDQDGKFYQIRKRNVYDSVYKSTMPVGMNNKIMKKATMCIISHHMSIEIPSEVSAYYDEFFEPIIIANHLKK